MKGRLQIERAQHIVNGERRKYDGDLRFGRLEYVLRGLAAASNCHKHGNRNDEPRAVRDAVA